LVILSVLVLVFVGAQEPTADTVVEATIKSCSG